MIDFARCQLYSRLLRHYKVLVHRGTSNAYKIEGGTGKNPLQVF